MFLYFSDRTVMSVLFFFVLVKFGLIFWMCFFLYWSILKYPIFSTWWNHLLMTTRVLRLNLKIWTPWREVKLIWLGIYGILMMLVGLFSQFCAFVFSSRYFFCGPLLNGKWVVATFSWGLLLKPHDLMSGLLNICWKDKVN